MNKGLEQKLLQRRYTNGHQAHGKILDTLVIRDCKSKPQWDTTLYPQELLSQNKTKADIRSVGKDMNKLELLDIIGRNIKLFHSLWKTV